MTTHINLNIRTIPQKILDISEFYSQQSHSYFRGPTKIWKYQTKPISQPVLLGRKRTVPKKHHKNWPDLNSQLGWMDVSDGGIPWDFYPPFFTIWETDPMGFITMKNRQQYFLEQCFKQASGIVAKIQANDHRISLM